MAGVGLGVASLSGMGQQGLAQQAYTNQRGLYSNKTGTGNGSGTGSGNGSGNGTVEKTAGSLSQGNISIVLGAPGGSTRRKGSENGGNENEGNGNGNGNGNGGYENEGNGNGNGNENGGNENNTDPYDLNPEEEPEPGTTSAELLSLQRGLSTAGKGLDPDRLTKAFVDKLSGGARNRRSKKRR